MSDEGDVVDRFVRVLSHEVRNPLMALQMAATELAELDDGQAKKLAEVVARNVGTLTGLVDDLVSLAAVDEPLDRTNVDLGEIVSAVAEDFPRVDVEVTAGMTVDGDPRRLRQLVRRLLDNATRFSDARVDVGVDASNGAYRLTVRDRGVGIDGDRVNEVFEPFVKNGMPRADDSTRRSAGVGLAIVERIVRAHQGEVWIESGEGEGTTVNVKLPKSKGDRATGATETSEQPLKVLLLDDEVDNRELLALHLKRRGYDVRTAATGAEALSTVMEAEVDVAILDVGLPDMSGIEVGRRIRADERARVLVALTGYGSAEDRKEAKDAGFDHHLVKPVELPQLREILEGVPRE